MGAEFSSIFFLDGANGVGDIVVTTGSGALLGNGPGIYVVALSGTELGFETSGALGDGEAIFGDLTGTLTGISDGASGSGGMQSFIAAPATSHSW